jgi:hypothetical protein
MSVPPSFYPERKHENLLFGSPDTSPMGNALGSLQRMARLFSCKYERRIQAEDEEMGKFQNCFTSNIIECQTSNIGYCVINYLISLHTMQGKERMSSRQRMLSWLSLTSSMRMTLCNTFRKCSLGVALTMVSEV